MLYEHAVSCETREEFEAALEVAYQLCLQTDMPMRVMGHCSPRDSKGGNGFGGVMFSIFLPETKIESIYSVRAAFPIDREVFDINYDLKDRLRCEGKVVCFNDWEIHHVTHVMTIPWNQHPWEYSVILNDTDAIYLMMKYNATGIRRGRLSSD